MQNKKKNQPLSSRYRYFQVLIFLGFSAPSVIIIQDLITLMTAVEFISQTRLEIILDKLKIPDRGRLIEIEKFHGQLQTDQNTGLPYWNIYLVTQNLTTRKRLLDALLKELLPPTNPRTKISPLEVHSVSSFDPLEKEKRLSFPNTLWYPGFFSYKTVEFDRLLNNLDVQEAIKTYPEKYKKIFYDRDLLLDI